MTTWRRALRTCRRSELGGCAIISGVKIHFTGIGGVGMAALAFLLKERGHDVSGCDIRATPRTEWLEGRGIPVLIGHSADHVAAVDRVVMTPAVSDENPERREAAAWGVLRYRGEVLAEVVSACDSVAVCGSHGKTTTSTFIAKLLLALGERVEWAIGGETGSFPVAGREGPAERPCVLVVEADESDGTLALYRAKTLVVTNCEYDHPDHFKTPEAYAACYETAKRQAGAVIESETLEPLDFVEALDLAPHNRRNARAAVEVARRRGHSLASIAAALPSVVAALPDRRFQKLREGVYTDYAHHPTEMACAVSMARAVCRGTLRVLFQPHRYSRTKALLESFPKAFAGADEVVLCPTYAAFEPPIEGGDIADLYAACRRQGVPVKLARSCEEAWWHARTVFQEGDVVLLLGAGSIIDLVPLVQSWETPPTRRIWIGAGSNTWKSDLCTGEVYERTTGPAGQPGATLGIPWMAGIPGTVGGWIRMNAGAFGHSISEVIARVKVDGVWIPASDCGFSYRHSDICGEIQDFVLKPQVGATNEPSAADYRTRRKKFPPGTKGSVFMNPPGDFAGRLLEAAGVKGLRVGGAEVWSEHANVIVSGPGATASDFLALARLMWNRVYFRFGISLKPEVCGLVVG